MTSLAFAGIIRKHEAPDRLQRPALLTTDRYWRYRPMAARNTTEKVWTVYRVTNTVNGKAYIGITRRRLAVIRWNEHVRNAKSGKKRGPLQHAILKHGAGAFSVETVYIAIDIREACMVERGLIAQHGTLTPNGYNVSSGGEFLKGSTFQDRTWPETHKEHLRKLAASMKGKKRSAESIAKARISMKGHAATAFVGMHGEKTRKAMSEKRKEYWAARGGHSMKGKTRSAETRAKMSAAKKAQWADPKFRKRRSGHKRPEQSEAIKARWADPAYAEMMSKKNKAAWTPERRAAKALEMASRRDASGRITPLTGMED